MNVSQKRWRLGLIDTLALHIEEESIITHIVGAGTPILTILPGSSHSNTLIIHSGGTPGSSIGGLCLGAAAVADSLVDEGEDTVIVLDSLTVYRSLVIIDLFIISTHRIV